MNINFTFVRHGLSCINAKRTLSYTTKLDKRILRNVLDLDDPHLSQMGVETSVNNGKVIENIMFNIHKFSNIKIDTVDLVGCSPLIRSMETAYYMTRNWKTPPKKIVIFPLLRELDESAVDPYSKYSKNILQSVPGYSMKEIREQKEYLKSIGILDFFDFSIIEMESELRTEPGNIQKFIEWFDESIDISSDYEHKFNVFIVTHAGVLHQFAHEGYVNNSGFILNTTLKDSTIEYNEFISMNNYLPIYFFKDYNNAKYNLDYYCPSNRCGKLCTLSDNKSLKKIEFNKNNF